MSELEHVLACQNILGEGPLWNAQEKALYWVDIEGKTINRYWPATGDQEKLEMDFAACALAFRESGGMVLATSEGYAFWSPETKKLEPIANPEAGKEGARFNDGKVDRMGRFWAGTMTPEGATSALYRLDPDETLHTMETGVTISNGIGWSPDDKTMYFVDTMRYMINAYDFDLDTGNIFNKRAFVQVPEEEGVPDGLTVDSEGYVWCALCMGGKIVRYDPTGKVDQEVILPVKLPTSCIFGGDNLDELYITTAWISLDDEQRKEQPYAGDLFRLKTEVKGLPEPMYKG
jgi:sugar lactone lactonase YvrE